MTVGETLARARRDAGLSIAEVSIAARVRQSVIDDIEHDDFAACGGDSAARGDIAAIARALGVDSGPLVHAYDAAARRSVRSDWIAATEPSGPAVVEQSPESPTPGPEPAPEPEAGSEAAVESGLVMADEDTQPIRMSQPAEQVTTAEPPGPIAMGELAHQTTPGRASWPARAALADRRDRIWIAMGAGLLAAAALGGILLIVGTSGGQAARPAVTAGGHRTSGGGAHPASGRRRSSSGHSARSPRRTRPTPAAHGHHVRLLVPAGIAAFGPGGTGHGDSPQLAGQALAGRAGAPWHSAWYTTARFGDLQRGTGLLVDMGRTVTITSAQIALGSDRGADLGLRIGKSPTLASMVSVAHANDAGGVVRLRSAPTRGRYVLVWFTRLPPDQAGTFEVFVYKIKLRGYS